jgi:hypothetical protein
VPTEVLATPRAGQQVDGLNRRRSKEFNRFLDDLASRGCTALAYRLSGPTPIDHLCVKHLGESLRVVVAFESPTRAWILLVGPHDDQDPVLNVYTELYRLLGVETPNAAGRSKPRAATRSRSCPPSWAPPSPTSLIRRERSERPGERSVRPDGRGRNDLTPGTGAAVAGGRLSERRGGLREGTPERDDPGGRGTAEQPAVQSIRASS